MPSVLTALRGRPGARTALSAVSGGRHGWRTLFDTDTHPGSWQQDVEINHDAVLEQPTLFACITLIAADIGKVCLKLVELDADGIWTETSSPAFSPVLRRPNQFQTTQLFIENWVFSLLSHGNAYVVKIRDERQVVVAMYVLDPTRVTPLVAPDGAVYYRLHMDDLSHVHEEYFAVPASEIIHDRINCIFHPLVGLSPIFACGLASTQALKILKNSVKFFENMSRPSGILTAPGLISDAAAARLKDHWDRNYSGGNIGKVAVLGDGLKYESMSVTPLDAQLVEQLKLSAENVCSVFHVPAYMVGAGPVPPNNNVQSLTTAYFGQCLQTLMKRIEDALDEGLGLAGVPGKRLGTMFDLDDLLRMDTATLTATLKDQVGAGITKIDEARRRLNYGPVKGGDTPYLQQQNYSLSALNKRDTGEDPFKTAAATASPATPALPAPTPPLKAVQELLETRVRELREDVLAKAVEQQEQHAAALHDVQALVERAGARAEAAEAAVHEAQAQRDALAASAPIEGAEALADMLVARFDEASECV